MELEGDSSGVGTLFALSNAFHCLSISLWYSGSSISEGYGGSDDDDELGAGTTTSCFLFLACSFVRPRGRVGILRGDGDVNDSDESEESEERLMMLGLDVMVFDCLVELELGICNVWRYLEIITFYL